MGLLCIQQARVRHEGHAELAQGPHHRDLEGRGVLREHVRLGEDALHRNGQASPGGEHALHGVVHRAIQDDLRVLQVQVVDDVVLRAHSPVRVVDGGGHGHVGLRERDLQRERGQLDGPELAAVHDA